MSGDQIRRRNALADHVAALDSAIIDLTDIEAAPVLNDQPGIQTDIHYIVRNIRRVADFLWREIL